MLTDTCLFMLMSQLCLCLSRINYTLFQRLTPRLVQLSPTEGTNTCLGGGDEVAKYRRKPILIEAVKITRTITIETAEGKMQGYPGDYLITDKNGDQYPCKAEQFEQEYERVKDSSDIKSFIGKTWRRLKGRTKNVFLSKE